MKGTKVEIVICSNCRNGIYSVARHDFHYCPCGHTFIDGGFDYIRCGSTADMGRLRFISLTVPQTKEELVKDYNESYRGIDSNRDYGTLSWDEVRNLYRSQFKKDIRMVASKSGSQEKGLSRKAGRN